MAKLDGESLRTALAGLPEWTIDGDAIVRSYHRRDWLDAIALLNLVAEEAQRRDHHPDVWISGYRNLTFRLTSHDSGGVTQRDVSLAAWIEEAAAG